MSHLRRATAFVVLLLLTHLTFVGSGFTCAAGDTAGESAMATMPGMMAMMDMPGMASSEATSDMRASPSHTADPSQPAAPGSESCDLPWAPDGCARMIPCAPNALASAGVASAVHTAPSHAEVAWELGTPPSAIITPDPPPPKA